MLKKKTFILTFSTVSLLSSTSQAFAAPTIKAPDTPPGMLSFGGNLSNNLLADPNIIAASIGVIGLIFGCLITIFATYFIRWLDVKREDKRERLVIEQNKREKEYQMKQELYRKFLDELADLETFEVNNINNFKRNWARIEVKVDLVASEKVRFTKEDLQKTLFDLAENNIKKKTTTISSDYIKTRDELLAAIREDIDIFQKKK